MGFPKSMVLYNNIPLIEHIYNTATLVSKNVVILGEGEIPDNLKKVKCIKDKNLNLGPLSAIVSSFEYKKTDWIYWATDMPFVTKDVLLELIDLKKESPLGVIPYRKDIKKYESYFGYYSKELLQKMISLISCDVYSVQRILEILQIKGNSYFFDKYKNLLKDLDTIEDLKCVV